MALVFVLTGVIGLVVTVLALRSRFYRQLSERYAQQPGAGGAAQRDRLGHPLQREPDRPRGVIAWASSSSNQTPPSPRSAELDLGAGLALAPVTNVRRRGYDARRVTTFTCSFQSVDTGSRGAPRAALARTPRRLLPPQVDLRPRSGASSGG